MNQWRQHVSLELVMGGAILLALQLLKVYALLLAWFVGHDIVGPIAYTLIARGLEW